MLETVANLHKLCFPKHPWTSNDFYDLKKSGCEIVASQNGFIVWRSVLDEAELVTIGVHPDTRNNGIAKTMLLLMENELKKINVKKVFLEVSSDNIVAQKLYSNAGYIAVGKRPKYYDGIDAILMEKKIN